MPVFQREFVLAGNCGEAEPDILQHLHVIIVFTEVVFPCRNRVAVTEQCQREFIVELFLPFRRIFRSRHSDYMKDRFVAVSAHIRQFYLKSSGFPWCDPCGAHPRPISDGNGIRKLIRFQNDLSGTRRRHVPVISCSCHDHMATEIFRPDGKFDPPVGKDILCRELKCS